MTQIDPHNRLWENEAPLALDPKSAGRPSAYSPKLGRSVPFEMNSWGNQFRNIHGLKAFRLELETVEKKTDELDAIVARAPHWDFVLGDGSLLVLDHAKTKRTGWVGYPLGEMLQTTTTILPVRKTNKLTNDAGFNKNERDFDVVDEEDNDDESFIDPPIPEESDDGEEEEDLEDLALSVESLESGESNSSQDQGLEHVTPSKFNASTAKEKLAETGVRFIDENLEPMSVEDDKLMTYYVVTLTWNARTVNEEGVL